jgi:hypothetical protein
MEYCKLDGIRQPKDGNFAQNMFTQNVKNRDKYEGRNF